MIKNKKYKLFKIIYNGNYNMIFQIFQKYNNYKIFYLN